MRSSFPVLRQSLAIMLLLAVSFALAACAPRVTVQEERALGADLARQINEELPIVDDPAIDGYINRLGRSIARVGDPHSDFDYTFYVANTPEINAFAVPGGHVYVYRGLIERAANESQLAGVLAHEVAHVVERHGIEQWQRAQQAQLGLAVLYGILLNRDPGTIEQTAIQLGAAGVFAGYSRTAEREADDLAIGYLMDARIHPAGLVEFFEVLLAERDRDPGRLEQFFATHPTTRERIERTRAQIEALPPDVLAGLRRDHEDFQRFRRQVSALPESGS